MTSLVIFIFYENIDVYTTLLCQVTGLISQRPWSTKYFQYIIIADPYWEQISIQIPG